MVDSLAIDRGITTESEEKRSIEISMDLYYVLDKRAQEERWVVAAADRAKRRQQGYLTL